MNNTDDSIPASPATLDLHHVDEQNNTHHSDKGFLFSSSGGQRSVWVVHGWQVPKIAVLSVLCAVLALLALILAIYCGQLRGQQVQGQAQIQNCAAAVQERRYECETTGCLRQAAEMAGYINRSTTPCEDFYQYACGRFDDIHPLGTQITYGIHNVLESINKKRVEDLLEKTGFHNDFSATSKAKTFFGTCMASFYNSTSSDQMMDLINSLGGMDLFSTFDKSSFSFTDVFFHTREVHRLRLFFSITWLQTMHRVMITLPRLGLKNVTIYTDESEAAEEFRKIYRGSIITILKMMEGEHPELASFNRTCNDSCALEVADDVLYMETEIAKKMPASGRTPIPVGPARNVMSLHELDRISPAFKWKDLLNKLFGPGIIPEDSSVQVPGRDYIISVSSLIENTNSSIINNYIKWNLLRWYLPAMGPLYATLSAEMNFITRGTEMKRREEVCYDLLRHYFPRAVRALFIQNHIGTENVGSAKRLMLRIRNFLATSFNWMSPTSRDISQRVLNELTINYGHSPWVTDPSRLNSYYREVSLTTDNFFQNVVNVDRFKAAELKSNAKKLGNDDDTDDDVWVDGDASDVKISYSSISGALKVPTGSLQVPLFHHENPDYINAAALGSLVLRELATPFFLRHRTHRLADWWDAETTSTYRRYSLCLMRSLDNYTVRVEKGFEYKTPKSSGVHRKSNVRLDPRRSARYVQSEHLAFQLSFNLFKRIQAEDGFQLSLPGTQGQTPDQLFFLAYVQSRCRHTNPYLKVLINTAFKEFPQQELINNFVYNSPDFMEAYQCKSIPAKHSGNTCRLE